MWNLRADTGFPSASAVSNQAGFTMLEILVALGMFAVIAIGTLGIIGATNAGGFLEGFGTTFATARSARDYTAGSVYMQAFQEYVAGRGTANATPGSYCVGTGCSPAVPLPAGLAGYPTPPGRPYQLNWTRLTVVIQQLYWDDTTDVDGAGPDLGKTYCIIGSAGCSATVTLDVATRVRSTLTWVARGVTRTLTVERFVP